MNICVYCSASNNIAPAYFDIATQLGEAIAQRGDTLVYGGSSAGLMGQLARTVQARGARCIGIIPQALVDMEVAYHNADELVITANMRERKATMEARAEAFLALPGGVGTMEEVFEIMVARSLNLLHKPLVLLNHGGFYDPLIQLLEHMQGAKFLRAGYETMVYFAPTIEAALDHIDGNPATPQ
ncbi:MAG TPA: TIGR00730 family Rossman fold protein [Phototrophicaceae bacterium]|nr:TIGR00730 family Rossman fold protein [Phototrophicaceae bacterium]